MYARAFTKSRNQVYSTSMQNAAYIGMDLIPLPKPKFLLEILYAVGLLYSWTKVFMLIAFTLVPFLTSTGMTLIPYMQWPPKDWCLPSERSVHQERGQGWRGHSSCSVLFRIFRKFMIFLFIAKELTATKINQKLWKNQNWSEFFIVFDIICNLNSLSAV